MSSKIYFNNNQNKILQFSVRAVSEAYRFVSPKGAKKQLRRLLLTPQKRKPDIIPGNISSDKITTQYGDIMTYSIGEGPEILFIHGWSGSGSQFFGLMEAVANMGYRAVTYDHYKHGNSGGNENNYPLFVKSIGILAGKLYEKDSLACIVSHSMGCSATLDLFKGSPFPHFLIAPLFNFYDELETRVTGIGISQGFFDEIVSSIETDYEMSVKDHDSIKDISQIRSPIQIIHSQSDKFALHKYSQDIAEKHDNIQLNTIDNIGHMRIVSVPETEKALVSFLNRL